MGGSRLGLQEGPPGASSLIVSPVSALCSHSYLFKSHSYRLFFSSNDDLASKQ